MHKLKVACLLIIVHIAALLPLMGLLWDLAHGQLTANPIQEIQLRTGTYTLNLLVLTLACAPVYNIFGLKQALQIRRTLGLYAFAYACLHFLNFIGLDYRFDFALIRADIADKRFVIVGFAAFLILLALAVTSAPRWQKRLDKHWKPLHRLIYVAVLLAALHFIWQTKIDFRMPFIYSGVVLLLLLLRIPGIKNRVRIPGKRQRSEQDDRTIDEI